jgi:hypothetical protein
MISDSQTKSDMLFRIMMVVWLTSAYLLGFSGKSRGWLRLAMEQKLDFFWSANSLPDENKGNRSAITSRSRIRKPLPREVMGSKENHRCLHRPRRRKCRNVPRLIQKIGAELSEKWHSPRKRRVKDLYEETARIDSTGSLCAPPEGAQKSMMASSKNG